MGGKNRKQVRPSTPTRSSPRLTKDTPAGNSSSEESDSYNTGKGPAVAKSSQHPSKKARVVNPDDMDIAFAENPSKPLNPSAPVFTASSSPKNDTTVDPEKSTAAPRDLANNGSQKPDNPSITPIQDDVSLIGNYTAGSPATPSPDDHQNKSQHDSTNKNLEDVHHDSMNTNESPVTSDDVTKLLAASPLANLIKENETKQHTLNRVKYYLNSKYPTSFKSARYYGTGEETLIIVSFKDDNDFKQLISDDHAELKQSDSSESLPQFHPYDAEKVKAEESLRSIVVTDIPLFLKQNEVKSRFAQHGTIQKFSMTTPP